MKEVGLAVNPPGQKKKKSYAVAGWLFSSQSLSLLTCKMVQ